MQSALEAASVLQSALPDKRISTVVAAYNAERTIAQALDSALAQNCTGHEIVVVNDGSTDRTGAILEKYRGQVRILEQRNQGAGAARNAGVAQARGNYIAFLDSDDLWLSGKLERMVTEIERHPSASLAFSEYSTFADGGVEYGKSSLGHSPSMRELMETLLPPILTSTWVLPKRTFERSGGFCGAFRGGQGFEDSWLLLILRELGEFCYIPEVLTRYRIDERSENADKYGHALSTFISLSKRRYGRKSKALVRNAKNLQCRFLLSKLAHQMDRNERSAAFRTLARMARLQPAFFFRPEFIKRLGLIQNTKRLWQLTTGHKPRRSMS
jgi:glycosyltransferase involved in cell wall biosynthesis